MTSIDEDIPSLDSIEQRQRKERKQLQSVIQNMKKSITKGDKSKKKEIAQEISKLEEDLNVKHTNEITQFKNQSGEAVITDTRIIENGVGEIKLSKAQKRRDKKATEQREREERIKQQEIDNLNGPRLAELKAINDKLSVKQLSIFNISSDGDCLYKAISHQLQNMDIKELSVAQLRSKTAIYLRTNKTDFLPFLTHPDTYEMLTDEQFDEYCEKIEKTNSWGGQVELRVLSHILERPIHIIQATGPDMIQIGDEFESSPLVITYHRHLFGLGEHYNSTIIDVINHTQSSMNDDNTSKSIINL